MQNPSPSVPIHHFEQATAILPTASLAKTRADYVQSVGPVVRINPYELHIKDPDFYDQIYASAPNHRDKFEFFVKSPDSDNATGFTVDHDLHRLRREALGPFFSKRNVTSLEPRIRSKIELLCQRLDEHVVSQDPINLTVASLALTMDILTDYAFADDFGLLQEDFNIKWRDTILSIMQALPTVRHFKWFLRVVTALPASLARLIAPDMSQLIAWKEVCALLMQPSAFPFRFFIYNSINRIRKDPMADLINTAYSRASPRGTLLQWHL